MRERRSHAFLLGSAAALTVCFLVPVPGRAIPVAVLSMSFPIALVLVALARRRTPSRLVAFVVALAAWLALTAVLVVVASHRPTPLEPWLFGLPPGVWMMLIGFWFVPLVMVSIAFPWTFSDMLATPGYDLPSTTPRTGNGRLD